MKLKRHHNHKLILIMITFFFSMVSLLSMMIIISTISDLSDLIKVPGVYKDNTIIYTTLNDELIELKDTTVNVYRENEKLYVYYHEDDVRDIETSTLIKSDIKTSISLILMLGTPFVICLILYVKKLKLDKEIIKCGKQLHLNISKTEELEDKLFGKYKIIIAKYEDENKKKYNFISDKIYDKKLMNEIKETGSVHIYYMTDNPDIYVVYEYSKRATIDWFGE